MSSTSLNAQQRALMQKLLRGAGVAMAPPTEATVPRIEPDTAHRHDPYPLTDIQQGYLLGRSRHFVLGNVSSHAYLEYEIEGLDIERYRMAWQQVIARHDMLRTVVHDSGRQQTLSEVPPFEVAVQDLRGLDEAERERALLALREKMSHEVRPADCWPLFDVRVSLIGGDRQRIHWSFDAIVSDVYSNFIFQEELLRCYQDPQLRLPRTTLSFRDYVLALKAQETTETYARAQRHWDARIETLPAAPALPLAKELAELKQPHFTRLRFRLPQPAWEAFRQQSRAIGVTTTVALLTAFSHVLRRWSRESRFTLNMTLFNRQPWHPEMNAIVGDFTATMLLGVEALADGQDSAFASRARRIQDRFLDDLEHRLYSGVRVLQAWASRSPGQGQKLAPVVFTSALQVGDVSEQLDTGREQLGRLSYSITQTPQVLLDHQVYEEGGCLCIHWDHVAEAFPPGLIDAMFEAYAANLQTLAADASAWRRELAVALPRVQQQRRTQYNATRDETLAAEADEPLYAAFLRQASARPEATAVIDGTTRIAYGELARRAQAVAAVLRAGGAMPDTLVAITCPKGWRQVVAALGIQMSGAAYVPIDPELPRARREELLQQTGAAWVVTDAHTDAALEWPAALRRLVIDDAAPASDTAIKPWPCRADDLAYVIFTSGSTGRPKGVVMDHRAVRTTLLDLQARLALEASDRVFALSSLSFDLSVFDIFGTLAAGAAIVMPRAGHDRDPSHWWQCVREHGVSVWNSVPALMEMLLAQRHAPGALDSVRAVLLSGDWIPLALPEAVHRAAPKAALLSLGGATEAAIWSIQYPVARVLEGWRSIPYGMPLANQSIHVLDDAMQPCPEHVVGRLYIGGDGLAQGYWGDAAKTAERFVTHPRTGERLYFTGDLGSFRPEGHVEFLGREDFQVKVGGHRIELGEIEAVLARHAAVRQAVVQVVADPSGQRRLVAYVVPADAAKATNADLQAFLAEHLPRYMLPAAWVQLEGGLPLSSNGKVDRQALPAPDFQAQRAAAHVAPADAMEQRIAAIVQQRLACGPVSAEDNFFDIGASSLDIVAMHQALEEQLGRSLSVVAFFEHASVRALARHLGSDAPAAEDNNLMAQARERAALTRRRPQRPATAGPQFAEDNP
ncbi:non-ribosomal peptide synthetase [Variovorax boronicumulans]|uniref:non-ribosomal peptide synthetase n=1 Tax=Variovorax boronicumulans TaxID=436515 RepID=UPI0033994326